MPTWRTCRQRTLTPRTPRASRPPLAGAGSCTCCRGYRCHRWRRSTCSWARGSPRELGRSGSGSWSRQWERARAQWWRGFRLPARLQQQTATKDVKKPNADWLIMACYVARAGYKNWKVECETQTYVGLMWHMQTFCPGYTGVNGSDQADRLAGKEAATMRQSQKIWSVEELGTLPAGTRPRTSHYRSPG